MEENSTTNFEKARGFIKKYSFAISIICLLLIIVLAIYARTSNIPNLKDVTTGNYTLGPDLDPFLYLRNAQEIVAGKLTNPDMMWSAPLGSTPYAYGNLMPWAIVYLYKFLNIFSETSVEYAAIILPVILFSITLIFFFLFVQKAFSYLMKKEFSYLGAIVGTLIYAVINQMLHRTTAGIPEIESLGMLFFWPAFYFFMLAWQSEKLRSSVIYSALSGISTGLMIWSWGGYKYIFMSFSLAFFIAFFFQKLRKKNIGVYAVWWLVSILALMLKGVSITGILSSIQDTLFSTGVLFIVIIDFITWNYVLKDRSFNLKIPKKIFSILLAAILAIVAISIIFGPGFIISKVTGVFEGLLHPFGEGRIGLTVAENRAPYFVEVNSSFAAGLFNNKIVISLFWFFFFGTILMFYSAFKHFDKTNRQILLVSFIIFLLGFIFSRISPDSLLNGDNLISQSLYFGSLVILAGTILYIFYKEKQSLEHTFYKINFSYILLLSLIFFAVVSMRGAVRLFFIISPPMIIASSFLVSKLGEMAYDYEDKFKKILFAALFVIAIVAASILIISYAKASYAETSATVPSPNDQQWQYAMAWVRGNTNPGDIFVHWWDYGFWVQTIGQRPTVTDGAHGAQFWDHTTARYLMTAKNEKTTLQLMKAHNVSYVLFDPSDIGKYSAFASIGSDKSCDKGGDRCSWIPTFSLDEKQTQELKNETVYVYSGNGFALDEDFILDGKLFPKDRAIIGGFIVHLEQNQIKSIEAAINYNNQWSNIPLKYAFINKTKIKLSENGLDAVLYFVPALNGYSVNPIGGAMFLSERVSNSQFARMYLLGETEFSLAYQEDAFIIKQLKQNGIDADFVLAGGGIWGPIKIFKVPDLKNVEYHEEYLKTVSLGDEDFAKLDYLGT